MAIISFFSGTHCHADEVLQGVARQLNYRIIDNELTQNLSRRFDINQDKMQRALYGPDPFFNKFTHEREKTLANTRVVLSELIKDDNGIITGCAGFLIPRTIAHILRVCIIANHEYRVARASQETRKSPADAAKIIHNDDKRNFGCTTYLFDKNAYDQSLFDIVLPMHNLSVEDAVGQICRHTQSDAIKVTSHSQQAVLDFNLSARVNQALADEGYRAEVFSERGNVILLINDYVVRMKRHEEKLAEAAGKVDGVNTVTTRIGPRYKAPAINPWSEIEGPPKIMLVDDEKEFVHTLSERLRTRELESSIAYDGEQALDMLKQDVPDVMVLDLMMPGIDGIEVLRRIKQDYPQVEVIILTGHGSEREEKLADELGAFAYLHKPVDIDNLAKVMKAAYKKTSRTQET